MLSCALQNSCCQHWFRVLFRFASILLWIITTQRHHALLCSFIFWMESTCFFVIFHVRIAKCRFASLATSATRLHQHDALHGAHVQNLWLCVAFRAPWFWTKNHSFCNCSKYVTFSTVSAPACQKWYIFPMNFNNSYLRQISSIFDRCARCRIPMVWRTCRFWVVRNDTYFKRILTIPLFAILWPSKFLLLPVVSGTFSFCIDFMVAHHDPSSSLVATFLHYLHEIPNVFSMFSCTPC